MTSLTWQFKLMMSISILSLLTLSLGLWLNTPDLFVYFNQAFCAH